MSTTPERRSASTPPGERAFLPRWLRWQALVAAALALLAGGAAAVLAPRMLATDCAPSADLYAFRPQPEGEPLPVLWSVPEFGFMDQHEARVTDQDLRGRVWVADFIFTTCTNACPVLSAHLSLLMRELPDPELRFVSFSVDPAHDTPAVLRAYAERWQPDESRWVLLATDEAGLGELAQGMRVTVEGTSDAKNPILHSSSFFLVDASGQVRGVYSSIDPLAPRRLLADVATLRGSKVAPPGTLDADGRALYGRLGCAGCHDNPLLAPSLIGLAGAEVRLEGGATRRADAEYVRDALVSPGRELTAGYLNLMPAYGGRLTEGELDRLVAHVLSLSEPQAETADPSPAPSPVAAAQPLPAVKKRTVRAGGAGRAAASPAPRPASASAPPARIVEDPVCHMQVRVTPDTPIVSVDGRQHYFCSEMCRDRFAASRAGSGD